MRAEDVNPEWVARAMDAFARADGAEIAHIIAAVAPLIAAAERERAGLLLEAAAERVAPTGKRSNHIDIHVADVLREKAAAIRALGDADG